jgi:hypothetical protein
VKWLYKVHVVLFFSSHVPSGDAGLLNYSVVSLLNRLSFMLLEAIERNFVADCKIKPGTLYKICASLEFMVMV